MSRFNGGIYSRPRGKTAGIVWGAARTREGKVATSRELVPPSNPNTTAQQTQRTKFAQALFIVRALASAVYQVDWNRAIGQLPGFQSMQSIFLNALDSAGLITAPANTNLGTLDVPSGLTVTTGTSGNIDLAWSDSTAGNGTLSDLVKAFAIPAPLASRPDSADIVSELTAVISGGSYTFNGLSSGVDYIVCVWRKGVGNAAGLLSVAQWYTVAAG